jgi:methylated-DNA-[protein]-cysteine S-methyltransferase
MNEPDMTETLHLLVDRLPTPVGELMVVADRDAKLRAMHFADREDKLRDELRLHYGPAGWTFEHAQDPGGITSTMTAYFAGDLQAIDRLPVATGGTAFQRQVWAALREIPCGATWTYSQLARHIGRAAAVRAVGHANGSNPISIVVPCHRVVGADGTLTGYGGGLERKRWLLAHEAKMAPGRLL